MADEKMGSIHLLRQDYRRLFCGENPARIAASADDPIRCAVCGAQRRDVGGLRVNPQNPEPRGPRDYRMSRHGQLRFSWVLVFAGIEGLHRWSGGTYLSFIFGSIPVLISGTIGIFRFRAR